MEIGIALVVFDLLCIFLCAHVARKKHVNPVPWGAMGAVFGPLALIVLLLVRKDADL